MSYDESQRVDVQFQEHDRVVRLLLEIGERLDELQSLLNPAADDWPLQHGEVGVISLPQDPPEVVCILEHPDTGHWMIQRPCGGIFIGDLTTGTPTITT